MKKQLLLTLLLFALFLLPTLLLADDYAFDVSEFEPRRLEINYRLDLRPAFSWLEPESPIYKLSLESDGIRRSQSLYSILAGTNGSYKAGDNSTFFFDGLLSMNRALGKTRDSQVINEAYLRFDIDTRLQLGIGKKTLKWGKGYAWNPVNFFGRQKDLSDIELALSGYSMLFSQHSRSLEGPISNMTLTMALLPVASNLNDDFTDAGSLNFATQLYMLTGNTDIDLYLMAGTAGNHKFGADLSRNLSSNLEIHAELAHELEGKGYSINTNGLIIRDQQQSTSLIAGARYLDRRDITYFLEYIRNGSGFKPTEMDIFYNAVDLAIATGNKSAKRQAAQNFTSYVNRQFAMEDYLYLRASKPELFGDLYLNGAIFTVINLNDKSTSTSFEVNFTGQTNRVVSLRLTTNLGNKNSEFGQKLNSDKVELRYQYFF